MPGWPLTVMQRLRTRGQVVLDLEMPFLNGIKVTWELRKAGPTPAVVICSVENDAESINAAQEAGALGFVSKLRMHRDLIKAVKMAAAGTPFVYSS